MMSSKAKLFYPFAIAALLLTATGLSSGEVAYRAFTDAIRMPTLLTATVLSASEIQLQWTNNTNAADEIHIERKLTSDPDSNPL